METALGIFGIVVSAGFFILWVVLCLGQIKGLADEVRRLSDLIHGLNQSESSSSGKLFRRITDEEIKKYLIDPVRGKTDAEEKARRELEQAKQLKEELDRRRGIEEDAAEKILANEAIKASAIVNGCPKCGSGDLYAESIKILNSGKLYAMVRCEKCKARLIVEQEG